MPNRLLRSLGLILSVVVVIGLATLAMADDPKKTVGTSTAATSAQTPTAGQVMPIQKFECTVQGTPVEFPDDIYIRNVGTAKTAKGTTLHWEIPNTSRKGDYTLTADLPAGSGVTVSGAVPGGVSAGVKCTITVKESGTMAAMPKAAVRKPVQARPIYSFGCVVQGTPVEFPDDIYITNAGTSKVTKGTKLGWSIPNTDRKGEYTLTEDLLAGKGVFVSGAVPGGMAAGIKCSVAVK